MSLDYNLNKCGESVDEVDPERQHLFSLCVSMMVVGMNRLETNDDVAEFVARVRIWEALHRNVSTYEQHITSMTTLARGYIGIQTNVSSMSRHGFLMGLKPNMEEFVRSTSEHYDIAEATSKEGAR